MPQVSLGRSAGSSPRSGAASAMPSPSTPSSAQARLARVGPRSPPPCFFDPPTIVGAILFAWRAQRAAPGHPRAPIRSTSDSPTVSGGTPDGAGQRNQRASAGRSATSTKRGRNCGTPKSDACSSRQPGT
jgi:hypothetical protein